VEGAATTAVAGVERGEQVDDFGAAHLPHHEPVGPHPQRLPHQVPQGDLAGPLLVGGPGLQPEDVRMVRAQFGGVLGEDDAGRGVDKAEQAAQQRGLPETKTGT
jgi:hypothetical protein